MNGVPNLARQSERFVCQSCGAVSTKWAGRCAQCDAWNSITEEAGDTVLTSALKKGNVGRHVQFVDLNATDGDAIEMRTISGIAEFDRVCGGGLVPGSAILVGGDPGIGKSTILLQAVAALANNGARCAYISGEEAVAQIRMRAHRLALADAQVELASATNLRDILATLNNADAPHIVVIDSIQTMYIDNMESAPGTVSQVRASAQELIRVAKKRDIVLILVGHVTKEGQIAGPRVLEHMVDTVLYFEGERGHQFRILRAVKNRYGATDEIGVFEMTDAGLKEVSNPSALFLSNRDQPVSGAAVFAGMEGTRPLLVEIQALVTPSPLATPRRTVVGWDGNRLAMIVAVLEARCGVSLVGHDVFLNVAGGLRIVEPAADMAVAAALLSSLSDIPTPKETVFFGEISLSSEIRPVSHSDSRLKEAEKLGFARAIAPSGAAKHSHTLQVDEIELLQELSGRFTSELMIEVWANPKSGMEDFSIIPTDIGVVTVLLISAILALARGFVREVLAISSWIGAAAVTYYVFPFVQEPFRGYVKEWFDFKQTLVADIAAVVTIFIAVLVILAVISAWVSRKVQSSDIGALDRSLGFLFGLARGAVVVSLAYLLLIQFIPPKEHPPWVKEARSVPAMRAGAAFLISLVPEEFTKDLETLDDTGSKLVDRLKETGDIVDGVKKVIAPNDKDGYDEDQKKDMDRLINNSGSDDEKSEQKGESD